MNPSFAIRTTTTPSAGSSLLLVIGAGGFSYLVTDEAANAVTLVVYAFGKDATADSIAASLPVIIGQEAPLQAVYAKTVLVWDFPEVITVPQELNNASTNADRLELIYGNARTGRIRSDYVPAQHLHQVYRVPEIILEALPAGWQFVHQSHAYSLLSELLPAKGQHLQVLFGASRMTVVVSQEGQLQLIQQFSYANGDDAAYYLLQIAEQFEFDPQTVQLELGGMIDEQSSLYEALYKYFLHIQFRPLPEKPALAAALQAHPAHYFAHLLAFSQCV